MVQIQELLKHIVKNLVENSDVVTVSVRQEGNKRLAEIRVDSADFGRVIGKEGRTFKAIQALGAAFDPQLQERNITLDTTA